MMRGLIIRAKSGFYTVKADEGYYLCHLRGRLKRGPRLGDIAAIGDWVKFTPLEETLAHSMNDYPLKGKGIIEEIEERQRMLSRLAPTPKGEYQQIIIANPDQMVLVFACSQPAPRFGMIDRFLVIAEKHNIAPLLVINKVDLLPHPEIDELFSVYRIIGYSVIYTSTKTGQGIDQLKSALINKISVFVGPSGVGKSSLLNAIQPNLGQAVCEISHATQKGKHTTVERQLFPLSAGGFVADTPGLKALALWDIQPEELDGYFPEMRTRVADCTYKDCSHIDEPDCAIRAAVESGEIHPRRYQSYLRLRLDEEDQ